MSERIDMSAVRRCANANIRRTDRVVTQLYDEILAPSGVNGPQFGLLAAIAASAPISINGMTASLAMDRTTLTRNLAVLTKQHLIRSEEGADRRMRLVTLTQKGEQTLEQAWPLWREAQARIERALGPARFDALLAELAAVRAAALAASSRQHPTEKGSLHDRPQQ